ncbi:hypothetical protein GCM10027047_15950 [Rhodococcus aerolatus]
MPTPIRTLAELAALGVPASTARSRVARGRYRRLLPGVYAVRPQDVDTWSLCVAVTRWRPDAVLSHATAAWLWRVTGEPDVIEATVPRPVHLRTPPWLRLHRRALPPAWVTTHRGAPVLTPERALVDVLGTRSLPDGVALAEAAPAAGVSLRTARVDLARGVGWRGAPSARAALDSAAPGAASHPERLLGRALARRGLRLVANASVGPFRVDLLDPASRTVVEVDGRAFHSAPAVFAADRRRQNALLLTGHLVLRWAASDVLADVDAVADEVARVVRLRRGA